MATQKNALEEISSNSYLFGANQNLTVRNPQYIEQELIPEE